MSVISQGISTPAGLAEGSVASASQITPLYNALNAFVIPDTIGAFQVALADTTLHSVATGSSFDWSFTVSKEKAIFFIIPFSWSGGASPTFAFRVNGAASASTITAAAVAAGNGIFVGFMGGHDATDVLRPLLLFQIDSNAVTLRAAQPNTDLPNTDTTSIGFTIGAAGVTVKFKYALFIKEG